MDAAWIRGVWDGRGGMARLLIPFLWLLSLGYRVASEVRNLFFRFGLKRSRALGCPVISVGNLTVGGTGKSPTCLWLAQELRQHGFRVAVLSRGYGRQSTDSVILRGESSTNPLVAKINEDVLRAGDEPAMMHYLYGVTVGVGADRFVTAQRLMENAVVDLVILDDGFQHRQIQRDVDLLLLGKDFNGRLLPLGPFREGRGNLRRADFLLATARTDEWRKRLPMDRRQQFFTGKHVATDLLGFGDSRWKIFPLSTLYKSKVLVVSGIADPSGLYEAIHEWEGEIVDTLVYPDHHIYASNDWQQISRMGRNADLVITTEKDILKLIRYPFAKDKLLALRVAMTIENGDALIGQMVARLRPSKEQAA